MDVVVVGAGGHGMVVCDLLTAAGLQVIAFIDDDPAKHGTEVLGVPVFGHLDALAGRDIAAAMGIGDNSGRRRQFESLRARGVVVVAGVHPAAVISAHATIGAGTVAMANAVVNVAATIGENVILNTGCTVDHHCAIGPHSHIGPGATLAGSVRIGSDTLIGAGAVILPGVSVGSRCVVGAGAVVVRDVPDDSASAGVPARPLTRRDRRIVT
jgi:sugar O-acyltransferase (sialic acid O-acetyltransferase NeuD family)